MDRYPRCLFSPLGLERQEQAPVERGALVGSIMATHDDSKAVAEEKMNAVQAALSRYVESKEQDPILQKCLIDDVNRAIADYEAAVGKQ